MKATINTIGATIGARIDNKTVRCTIIGDVINNSVLIKTDKGTIFHITTNLVVWVNEG
jgi:hypothetical protein